MIMKYLEFPECESTYTWTCENARNLESGTVVTTPNQTAGRGQRGNHWESEPGQNLTFTMLVRAPHGWLARRQFLISEAVATSIASVLTREGGVRTAVKWPNDILAFDADGQPGKICGILIAHSLEGAQIQHSVIGAGVNINQTRFLSDAPNPVSLKGMTGRHYPLERMLQVICGEISAELERLFAEPDEPAAAEALHARYMAQLWRGDGGSYRWQDTATGEIFEASVFAVEPLGHLVLKLSGGGLRRYAFKEVAFI